MKKSRTHEGSGQPGLPLGLRTTRVKQILQRDFMFKLGPHIPLVPIEQVSDGNRFWNLTLGDPQKAIRELTMLIEGFSVQERELVGWLVGVRLSQRCIVEASDLGSVLDALYLAVYHSLLKHLLPKRVSIDKREAELEEIAGSILDDYLNGVEQLVQGPQLWPPCQTRVLPGWREMMQHFLDRDQSPCIRQPGECVLK